MHQLLQLIGSMGLAYLATFTITLNPFMWVNIPVPWILCITECHSRVLLPLLISLPIPDAVSYLLCQVQNIRLSELIPNQSGILNGTYLGGIQTSSKCIVCFEGANPQECIV